MGKILVACEESQAVTTEFRNLGHESYSCDILPCSGNYPQWHLQQDVIPLLDSHWDMIIAFPPCTHLAVSGAAWFKQKQKDGRQQTSIDFFNKFINLNCKYVAIENPIGIMSTHYRKPDQIIQPYQFGNPFEKKTCLWLKNLPLLIPTNIVEPEKRIKFASGKTMPPWYSKQWGLVPEERSKARSKTFLGIAKAMATQWGSLI